MKDWINKMLAWRPALPGVSMSGIPAAVGRGIAALWRSFWSVWGNPMTYPIIALIAVGMFTLGFGQGRHGIGNVRYTLATVRTDLETTKSKLASAEINEAAARKEAKDALAKLAALQAKVDAAAAPAPVSVPLRAKRASVPKKPVDKPWWATLGG